jgi:hypothetical protein
MATTGGILHPNSNNFMQDGARIEYFWSTGVGSGSGSFTSGHHHLANFGGAIGNVERQHFNTTSELQGFFIERADQSAFDLVSLDFRVQGTFSNL